MLCIIHAINEFPTKNRRISYFLCEFFVHKFIYLLVNNISNGGLIYLLLNNISNGGLIHLLVNNISNGGLIYLLVNNISNGGHIYLLVNNISNGGLIYLNGKGKCKKLGSFAKLYFDEINKYESGIALCWLITENIKK